jgi:hypothetical protein
MSIYLVLWQKGLVEREINELLRGILRDDENERNKSNHNRKTKVKHFPRNLSTCLFKPLGKPLI